MGKKVTLRNLKPGQIFKIVDDMDYEADVFAKKGQTPKRVRRTFYLEEWHAVVEGEYPTTWLHTVMFKHVRTEDGTDKSELADGDFVVRRTPLDLYDSEPPTEISIIEGKELRMIVSKDGLRAKMVNEK